MNPVHTFLAASMAVNVALLVVFANRTFREGSAGVNAAAVPGSANAAGARLVGPRPAPLWKRIYSTDLDELARRLQAAGFSRREIRAIMARQLLAKYDLRASRGGGAAPYWRNDAVDYSDPKVMERLQAQEVDQQEAWRKYVLGPELLADDPEALDSARRRFGNFSLEKLQALTAIEGDYQLLFLKQSQIRRPEGTDSSVIRDGYELLEQEKQADIVKLLSPEEYAEYELRNSRTAQNLRSQLDTFKPTEEEYKTLFAIQKAFNEKLTDKTLSSDDRQALLDQMNSQTVAAIGPDRMADYLESQRGVDKTARLISRLDLPARTYAVVRNIQEDVTQRANAVRTDPQLSAADRAAQLTTLAQTARAQLTATLGDRGFEAYNDLKGDWIRALDKTAGGKR